MEWLQHNFLAEMFGPSFLLFYIGVIVVTLMVCGWLIHHDRTAGHIPPPIPPHPDPFEIAYLRGGENEVTRLAMFDLLQRGYLEMEGSGEKEPRLRQSYAPPALDSLSPLEREVFCWFRHPVTAKEMFRGDLPARVKRHCADYELKLLTYRLLLPAGTRERAKRIGITGACVILGLGGYKFTAALANGHHNVAFLLMLGAVALILLACICRTNRLSARGRAYYERLQRAFQRLKVWKGQVASSETAYGPDPMLLMVGIFGVTALAATPHAAYGDMFHRASTGSAGGCRGGCGSSCGGGGCGGGGCGGCGGGS